MNDHWAGVYASKSPTDVSWYQPSAARSLRLLRDVTRVTDRVIDVGGGASTFADGLLSAGFRDVEVLDVAAEGLKHARARLGAAADDVRWTVADVLTHRFEPSSIDVWHDRAVFHFLVEPSARTRYLEQVRHAVRPGGVVLVATFAEDGPPRCSGLPVARYSAEALHGEFGAEFALLQTERETHLTPWGAEQSFTYCLCRLTVDEHASLPT